MKNRIIAIMMALAMLIVFPTSVFAENNAPGEPPSGEMGTPPEGGAPGGGGGFGGSTPPGGGTSDFEYTAATEITEAAELSGETCSSDMFNHQIPIETSSWSSPS